MSHHKRKGPKSTRSGFLLYKPQKHQGASKKARVKISNLKKIQSANESMLVIWKA